MSENKNEALETLLPKDIRDELTRRREREARSARVYKEKHMHQTLKGKKQPLPKVLRGMILEPTRLDDGTYALVLSTEKVLDEKEQPIRLAIFDQPVFQSARAATEFAREFVRAVEAGKLTVPLLKFKERPQHCY